MVLISVSGSASRFLPAERGTARLTVSLEHADRARVVREVGALHGRFVAEAKAQVQRQTATWWGSDQVRAQPRRRYVKDSDVYTIVQTATAEVRVKFRDFDALSSWVTEAGSVKGVSLDGVEWAVTEQQRDRVQLEVRVQAVHDAVRRAKAYASAIGGSDVTLQQLWEPGLRPNAGGGVGSGSVTRALANRSGAAEFELRPDDIEITAAVTADFLVQETA